MDYDNPQFVAAVKKILRSTKELVSAPNPDPNSANDNNRATDETRPPESQREPSGSEPNCKNKQVTCNIKRDWIDKMTVWFEGLGLVTLIIYTIFTIKLWRTAHQTLIEGRNSTSDQIGKMRDQVDALKKANEIAIASNRPWLGVLHPEYTFKHERDAKGDYMYITFVLVLKNAGKRPARVTTLKTHGEIESLPSCSETPQYDVIPPGAIVIPRRKQGATAHSFVVPDATVSTRLGRSVTMGEWQAINDVKGSKIFCAYVLTEYRDILDGSIHHTRDCWQFVPESDNSFAECFNRYPDAD